MLPVEALLRAGAGAGEGVCMAPIEAAVEGIGASKAGPGAGGSTAGMLIRGPSAPCEGAGAAAKARAGIVPVEILAERSGAGAVSAGMATAGVAPEEAAPGSPGAGAGAITAADGMLASGQVLRYPKPGAGAGAGMASRAVLKLVRSFAGTRAYLRPESTRLVTGISR